MMKASEQWRGRVLASLLPLPRRSSAPSHSARVHLTGTMMEVSPAPLQTTTTLYFSEPDNKENKEAKEIKENIMPYVLIILTVG